MESHILLAGTFEKPRCQVTFRHTPKPRALVIPLSLGARSACQLVFVLFCLFALLCLSLLISFTTKYSIIYLSPPKYKRIDLYIFITAIGIDPLVLAYYWNRSLSLYSLFVLSTYSLSLYSLVCIALLISNYRVIVRSQTNKVVRSTISHRCKGTKNRHDLDF
jgi:hypothetical protein